MAAIRAVTDLPCSPQRAFAVSLDLDVELRATARYGVRIVDGLRGGSIGSGETVTWQLRQFGIPIRHTSVISVFEPPHRFVDEMERGVLAAFRHEHRFLAYPGGCTMLDEITYRVPGGSLGDLVDRLVVRSRLESLLVARNAEIVRSV